MGDTQKIQELKGLIGCQPIDHKRGPIEDGILKLLVYGDRQMPETQVRIGGGGKACFGRFRKEAKRRRGIFAEDSRKERGEIEQAPDDFVFRIAPYLPIKETVDFDDSCFYGFAVIPPKIRVGDNMHLMGELKFKGGELESYGADAQ